MILSVLVLEIALLLVPLSFINGGEVDMRTTAARADVNPGMPFMTGVRLSSWDGQRQPFVMQIGSLETISKTIGPFELEDHRDFAAKDCYLRSDSASLAENLLEVGKLLVFMIKPFQEPTSKPPCQLTPKSEAKPESCTDRLVRLPPELKASPFACAITQPQGLETILRADLATFCPTESDVALEGNVKVTTHNQICLTAEHMIWRVRAQELNVQGDYSLQTRGREIRGRDACFSISGSGLESVKLKAQVPPGPGELPAMAPVAPMAMGGGVTGFHFGKKAILSHLSRMLFQILPVAVVPLPMNQGLQSANFSYHKPNTYPASSMKYSMQETIDRELFCEKSR